MRAQHGSGCVCWVCALVGALQTKRTPRSWSEIATEAKTSPLLWAVIESFALERLRFVMAASLQKLGIAERTKLPESCRKGARDAFRNVTAGDPGELYTMPPPPGLPQDSARALPMPGQAPAMVLQQNPARAPPRLCKSRAKNTCSQDQAINIPSACQDNGARGSRQPRPLYLLHHKFGGRRCAPRSTEQADETPQSSGHHWGELLEGVDGGQAVQKRRCDAWRPGARS